jgi:hypothetical protein
MNYATDTLLLYSLYSAASTQADIFEHEVKPLISHAVKGFNATVFTFGAESSGKTHTVIGTESDPGIIFRTVRALLEAPSQFLAGHSPGQENHFFPLELEMSFMELYPDRATDLLEPRGHDISLCNDHIASQKHCPEMTRVPIESNEQFLDRFRLARETRITARTKSKEQFCRSHTILTLYIRHSDGSNTLRLCPFDCFSSHFMLISVHQIRSGKLNIVDLACKEDEQGSDKSGSRLVTCCKRKAFPFSLTKVSRTFLLHARSPIRASFALSPSLPRRVQVIDAIISGSATVLLQDSMLTRLFADSPVRRPAPCDGGLITAG